MYAISRRQCRCACPGTGTPLTGTGLPDCLCSQCLAGPCFYEIDFGCCIECDGLRGGCDGDNPAFPLPGNWPPLGSGLLNGRKVTRVWRDECMVEDHCVYTARKLLAPAFDQYLTTFFLNGSACGGWLNFLGMDCQQIIDRITFLATTRITWQMDVASGTTTLTGTTDTGSTVVYQSRPADPWICPVAGDGRVNRLWMVDYPDSLPGNRFSTGVGAGTCQLFPMMVCVTAGAYNYDTPCTNPADVCNCCDAGAAQACFRIQFPSCGVDTTINTGRNASLPGSISDPMGACGYFWGLSDSITCPSGGDPFNIGMLIWCDGSDWQVRLYCRNAAGTYTLFCDTTATLTGCCPNFSITFDCADPVSPCCCSTTIPTPCCANGYPATLFATISYPSCAAIDGQVIQLDAVFVGPSWNGTWVGDFIAGSCGSLRVLLNFFEPHCEFGITILPIGSPACFQADNIGIVYCPLTSITFTATWSNANCSCCSSGTATVTITP